MVVATRHNMIAMTFAEKVVDFPSLTVVLVSSAARLAL
jgi:hypothetical protein